MDRSMVGVLGQLITVSPTLNGHNFKRLKMKKIKVFVGLDNKFVACERFPNDEEHAGLHDMLQDFLDYDSILIDESTEHLDQGFYELELDIEMTSTYDSPEIEAVFVLRNYKKMGGR